MTEAEKAACWDWLRARILVSQISGKNIAPFAPLNKVDLNPESYRQQVDEEIRKELEK